MTLRDELLRPAAYPDLRPEHVTRIETHLSWVFLLERDVFKVKRPVALGFVDFRTLAARRAACEAEVVLNRRLADGVYLGVVPIVAGPEGPVVGGRGDPIDYAVHMRRLDDHARADLLLARGALTSDQVDRMAERIARFHREAARSEEIARFGESEPVLGNVLENFGQTEALIESVMSPTEVNDIVRYQREFVTTNAPLFHARVAGGHVRDTHGDLRLEHVYFADDAAPTVVDCIEFNERFRYGDVCGDLAFLSMDLGVHGRPDLAERLLARYVRETGDHDLYALVDFYESYRAYVRGKIALFMLADAHADEAAREAARQSARRYFLFALAAGRPSLAAPRVIAVGGLVGSGKSTLADGLSRALCVPVVSSDRTRKQLAGCDALTALDRTWYSEARTDEVYREMMRRAEVVLRSGRPVILDASFRSAGTRALARALSERLGVPCQFVECRCDEAHTRERLRARETTPSESDARLPMFDTFRKSYEPVRELAKGEHLVVDTGGEVGDALSAALAALG